MPLIWPLLQSWASLSHGKILLGLWLRREHTLALSLRRWLFQPWAAPTLTALFPLISAGKQTHSCRSSFLFGFLLMLANGHQHSPTLSSTPSRAEPQDQCGLSFQLLQDWTLITSQWPFLRCFRNEAPSSCGSAIPKGFRVPCWGPLTLEV